MAILETQGLTKDFGRLRAVNGVSLEVQEGELTALIGPNGAGKTTFFNLISGRFAPTSGRVLFEGRDITGLSPSRINRLGISRTFQIINVFPDLTTFQNVKMAVLSRRRETIIMFRREESLATANEETARILKVIGLLDKGDVPCGTLSHADQRLVEIGIALGTAPKLLLLDEPTAGMAPSETEATVKFIRNLAEKAGVTILLTEHDMEVVFSVAQRLVVMHQGQIIADGTPDEVRGNAKVREAYLGE